MILSTVDNKTYINFSVIRCAVISFENGVIYFISWWGPASYVISSQVKGKLHWLHWQYVFEYMYWYFVDKRLKIRKNNTIALADLIFHTNIMCCRFLAVVYAKSFHCDCGRFNIFIFHEEALSFLTRAGGNDCHKM